MICHECGKEISDGMSTCPNCGCPIDLQREDIQYGNESKTGLAIASMVLGILSLVLMCIAIGYVLAIIGIILGIISLVQHYGGKGMAIAGVTTSAVTLFLLVVGILGLMVY